MLAALAGLVILHQIPALHKTVGIAIIVIANIVAVGTVRHPPPTWRAPRANG